MAKDHFIPATLLSNFSAIAEGPGRQRQIWQRVFNKGIFEKKAASIGYKNNLYTSNFDNSQTGYRHVDSEWARAESNLREVVEKISEKGGGISYSEWLVILVDMAAQILVRGKDINNEMEARPELLALIGNESNNEFKKETKNNLRLTLLNEWRGIFTAAKWRIIKSKTEFITSDLGFALFFTDKNSNEWGVYIPLSKNICLEIIPSPMSVICQFDNNSWTKMIPAIYLNASDTSQINRSIANFAKEFLVGSNEDIVKNIPEDECNIFNYQTIFDITHQTIYRNNLSCLSSLWCQIYDQTVTNQQSSIVIRDISPVTRASDSATVFSRARGVSSCIRMVDNKLLYDNRK